MENLSLRFQNAIPGSQELQMALTDIGHDHDIRLYHFGQTVHFAKMIDPHFNHGNIRPLLDPEDREWNAPFVIQVALCFMHAVTFA